MARKPLSNIYINVSVGSSSTVPEYAPGEVVVCDSGTYVYGSANGAIAEGYVCKFVQGVWDFDTVTTSESGATNTQIGVCVASGGLADNYWGWFWRGAGNGEYVYTLVTTIDVQLTTATTAGLAVTSGDTIDGLYPNGSVSSEGLRLCRSSKLLETNFTTAAS